MSDDEHMRKLNRIDSRIDSLDLGDRVLQKFRTMVASTNMHPDVVAFSSTISADIASHPAWKSGKARYDALLRNGKIRSAVAHKRH